MGRRGRARVAAVAVALVAAGSTGCAADVVATSGAASGEAARAPLEEAAEAATVPDAVCVAEERTLATAAAAYEAAEGSPPPSAEALVGGYLDQVPGYHELRIVDGEVEVVALAGGGCD